MEAVDLLCSRNARSEKTLVGRAQWEINQPPSLKRTSKLGRIICSKARGSRVLRALLCGEGDREALQMVVFHHSTELTPLAASRSLTPDSHPNWLKGSNPCFLFSLYLYMVASAYARWI